MPAPTASQAEADRNLLFGILALHMDFTSRDALLQALHAWVRDKATPLGQLLVQAGALRLENRDLLETLVQRHLELHHGSPRQSLAALRPLDTARRDLAEVADPDLQASLVQLPTTPPGTEDSRATCDPAVGPAATAGPRFRVLRPHAQGGRGQVSVALDEELHREVALKEIQAPYADDPPTRARFLLEAEVTGRLEHPGIVPVYGLGADGNGRPFYAMRLIQGDSFEEAIQRFHQAEKPGRDPGERTLALRQLLGRFVAVCQAVAYAHSRGVLHRDLKPGNVMLGPYGETLVVDWGLAKVVGRPETDQAGGAVTFQPSAAHHQPETQAGAVVGTPAYMSPEQAAGRLDQLGPASDVYSLGATLYTLLTGRPPFEGRNVLEILRRVDRGDFPPPCQVNRAVPPALEAVCRTAMALRPAERYAGALELSAEVEHWLADEPVTCYREPFRTRAARWLRRHQAVAVGAGVLLVTATAGLAVGLGLVNAERHRTETARQGEAAQRQVAEQERGRALDAAAEAKAVLEFFQEQVLAAARPESQDGGLGIHATIRQAVDAAEPKIAGAFGDRPLVEAAIRHTLGVTYWYLRQDQAAIRQHERALTLRVNHLGHDHPDTLQSANELALTYQEAGLSEKALPLLEQVLAKRREMLGPDHPKTLQSLNNLAYAYQTTGRLAKAMPLLEQVLAMKTEQMGPDHADTLRTANNLAQAYQATGQLDKAVPLLEQVLAKRRETLGPDHPETLQSLNNLAGAYGAVGQLAKALPLLEQALAKRQEKLGPDHANTLTSLNNLAQAYRAAGQLTKALPLFEQALAKFKEKLGPDHPLTLRSMSSLAAAYRDTDQLEKALPLFEQALAKQKEKLGPDHPDALQSMNSLAATYREHGDFLKAEPILRECLTLRQQKQPDDWRTFYTQAQLGASLLGQKKYAEAEPLLLAGYEGLKQRQAQIPAYVRKAVTDALDQLVKLYEAWGKPHQAQKWRAERAQLPQPPERPRTK